MKRLEHFQEFELPKAKNWDGDLDSSDEDSDIATAAAKIRADIDAELKATSEQSNSHNSKLNLPPPALLGPSSSNDASLEPGPVTPKSQVANGHTVLTTPKHHAMSSPAASIILTPTLVSATVPIVMTTSNVVPIKTKRGTKGVKRETNSTEKGTTKKRRTDGDPNAPKKPSNAFFWFCQDKRATLQEQFRGEGMAGQHDLTKALARLWSETKIEDRKVRWTLKSLQSHMYSHSLSVRELCSPFTSCILYCNLPTHPTVMKANTPPFTKHTHTHTYTHTI